MSVHTQTALNSCSAVPFGSAVLLLEVPELALQGVQAGQGHRVVLRRQVDSDRVTGAPNGLKGGTGAQRQLLRGGYGRLRGDLGGRPLHLDLLAATAATAAERAAVAPADRLEVRALGPLLLTTAQPRLLLLAPV